MTPVEVDAAQAELPAQSEMVVDDEARPAFGRYGFDKLPYGVQGVAGLAEVYAPTAFFQQPADGSRLPFYRMGGGDGYCPEGVHFRVRSMIISATFLPERSMPPKMGPMRGVPPTADDAMPQT